MRILLFLLLLFPIAAKAQPLVTDLSERELSITAGFSGGGLVLFGATQDPDAELIIKVQGPMGTEIVRRKEPVLGLWLNRGRMVFDNIPGYYDISASAPLNQIMEAQDLRQNGFGLDSLSFTARNLANAGEQRRYSEALIQYKQVSGLFALNTHTITRISPNLFRTQIWLPANVPIGNYQVTTYLVKEGIIVDTDQQAFTVQQGGVSGFVTEAAQDYAFFYGLFAVLLAMLAGWLSNEMFRRE